LTNKQKRKGIGMKKQMLFFSVAMIAVCMSLIILGCQTAKEVSSEEIITAQVNKAMEALKAKNIDGVLEIYSDKFEHYEWSDKAGFREFLQQASDAGYLDDLEIDLSKMQVKMEGNTGTAYPIEIKGSFGSTTVELVFTNENGKWLVTGMDATGI